MAPDHTAVARSLADREVAREVARLRLGATRTDRSPGSLGDALTVGAAVGLTVSEMRRVAGCSRQTIYNALRRPARAGAPADAQLGLEALIAVVAAGGELPMIELANRLRLPTEVLLPFLRGLVAQGLCQLGGSTAVDEGALVWATDEASEVLREHLDELLAARPDSIAVYVQLDEDEATRIADAAAQLVSLHEHVVMQAGVAPSVMSGPELALAVRAPTVRRAMAIAASLWDEIREQAGLLRQPARFASVIPPAVQPGAASEVLDTFVDSLVDIESGSEHALDLARSRYTGGTEERRLTIRCLTAAARALRRSLGQNREPREIETGDAAFFEYEAVLPLHVDSTREPIQKALLTALDRGVETLGPLPGGRLAGMTGSEGPRVVRDVQPQREDLVFIAHHAGLAVGHAAATELIDSGVELKRIITGQ